MQKGFSLNYLNRMTSVLKSKLKTDSIVFKGTDIEKNNTYINVGIQVQITIKEGVFYNVVNRFTIYHPTTCCGQSTIGHFTIFESPPRFGFTLNSINEDLYNSFFDISLREFKEVFKNDGLFNNTTSVLVTIKEGEIIQDFWYKLLKQCNFVEIDSFHNRKTGNNVTILHNSCRDSSNGVCDACNNFEYACECAADEDDDY